MTLLKLVFVIYGLALLWLIAVLLLSIKRDFRVPTANERKHHGKLD